MIDVSTKRSKNSGNNGDYVDMEVSLGDFVLTGGEGAAMVISDAVIRLLNGVIQTQSHEDDSALTCNYKTFTVRFAEISCIIYAVVLEKLLVSKKSASKKKFIFSTSSFDSTVSPGTPITRFTQCSPRSSL